MPSQPHIIQLRGPWQVNARNRSGHSQFDGRINVRAINDWYAWIPEIQAIDEIAAIRFDRKFKWPGVKPVSEKIELVMSGRAPRTIELNNQTISIATENENQHSRIDDLLLDNNQLTLHFHLDECEQGNSSYCRAWLRAFVCISTNRSVRRRNLCEFG